MTTPHEPSDEQPKDPRQSPFDQAPPPPPFSQATPGPPQYGAPDHDAQQYGAPQYGAPPGGAARYGVPPVHDQGYPPPVQDQPLPPPPGQAGGPSPFGAYGPNPYGPGPSGPGQGYGGAGVPAPTSAGPAASVAFSRFGRNAGVLIGAVLVVGIVSVVLQMVVQLVLVTVGLSTASIVEGTSFSFSSTGLSWGGDLISSALSGFLGGITTLILATGALRIVRTGRAAFGEFFTLPRGWVGFAGITAALGVIPALVPAAGVQLLLSLVTLVISVLVVYAPFHLIDAPDAPLAAFTASARTVGAQLGSTILAVLIAVGLTVAGVLLCLVGLLVAVPVVTLTFAALHAGFRQEVVPA